MVSAGIQSRVLSHLQCSNISPNRSINAILYFCTGSKELQSYVEQHLYERHLE